jgi:hypothetical protein
MVAIPLSWSRFHAVPSAHGNVTRKNAIFHFSIFFPILISNLFFPRHPTVPFSPACHPPDLRTNHVFFFSSMDG